MYRRLLICIIILYFALIFSCARPVTTTYRTFVSAETKTDREYEKKMRPINLIDNPTANSITTKEFQVKLRLYHNGGMLGALTAGLSEELMFGVTYGGENIIGQGRVKLNQSPGVNIRYKLMHESVTQQRNYLYNWPEIAIGFDSQGYGTYYADSLNRYQIKSKGIYLVVSQNVSVFKGVGFHGGANYSLEDRNNPSEKDINFFCGINFNLDRHISLLWEYDFAINDNDDKSLGSGKGYMNAAVRWFFSPQLLLEFSVKNLLKNYRTINDQPVPNSNRELKIIYYQIL